VIFCILSFVLAYFTTTSHTFPFCSANFKADTMKVHHEHIYKDNYPSAGVNFSRANIADNTSVNVRLSRLQGMPHVGCKNHLLAVDFNDTIKENDGLGAMFEHVNATMVAVKNSLKNTAVLRLLTPLHVLKDYDIRWTAKDTMLNRYVKLHPKLVEVASHPASTLVFDDSTTFLNKTRKACGWMKQVNVVTTEMQRDCISLAECDKMLEALHDVIRSYKDQPAMIGTRVNVYHNCPFQVHKARSTYTGTQLNPDLPFVMGVIKIQNGHWRNLNNGEKLACATLLKVNVMPAAAPGTPEHGIDSDAVEDSPMNMRARINRQQQQAASGIDQQNPYVNCNFIFGSTAAVERLWSVAKGILTCQRSSMTPMMFETLLFLRTNSRLWDRTLILTAIKRTRSARVAQRLGEDAEQQAMEDEDGVE
jgi:hypothetical protein